MLRSGFISNQMTRRFAKSGFMAVLSMMVAGKLHAQVNSGSSGGDGALDFSSITITTNMVIDMHDHTNGVYQYTHVNIPANVTVSFIPNAYNSPVTWLVQGNRVINGTVDVSGQSSTGSVGGVGGPGGWGGGSGGNNATDGQGPGGGGKGLNNGSSGGSYGTIGAGSGGLGPVYGNSFLLPLLGGSGGGGNMVGGGDYGGGGGGGAILIASSYTNIINGAILANGGWSVTSGGGSGGAIRLYSDVFTGNGTLSAIGVAYNGGSITGGSGRLRIDAYQISLGGTYNGVITTGFQPIIMPVAGQGVQLTIASIAGESISANPSSSILTPAAIIPGENSNPIQVVVNCTNLPLNTPVTVTVTPQVGSPVSAIGYNNTGTLASSTAVVSLVFPRGGGVICATAAP